MKGSFILFIAFCFLIFSCKPNKTSIESDLVNKCITAHGGIDNWKSLKNTNYTKNITLFLEDGSVEKSISQTHHYINAEGLTGTIEWKDSLNRKVTYQKGTAYKTKGEQKEENSQAALSTFNSAYYVLNMPWKLLDDGTHITYEGLDTILNNKIVHTLKVEYPNAGKQEAWEYYLDKDEYQLIANKVHHGTTYSLITNDSYFTYGGLKFNGKRTSYMVDSLGEVLYIRAKYEYIFE